MRVNLQPKEKPTNDPEGRLEVVRVWPTIQGEGPYAGTPAVFVRLAGCNLDCPGCDTDYTSVRMTFSPADLAPVVMAHASSMRTGLVVITGGEPFRQNLEPFVRKLQYKTAPHGRRSYQIQIETNGTLFPSLEVPLRFECVVSPKTPTISPDLRAYATAFKYVLRAGDVDNDGLPRSVLGNGLRPARPWEDWMGDVFVQPMDEGAGNEARTKENTAAALQSCMRFGYRLSVQTHKLVGVD